MHLAEFVVFVVCVSLTSTELKKVRRLQGYNPRKCSQKNHGSLTIVKDRQNNDKLLICVQENKAYVWKTTDGSNPTGEFYNPAFDCSDILNKNAEAQDGFYWIKLSGSVPIKVWCDLATDGGGFMLIGRKNNSITWTVPSNSDPVEPFGEPHWSSSLGDAPIIDFRIQVATEENFTTTKAHWSLRLRIKRHLKNLLIVKEGGCGRLSPGIGDISYVKDLLTEEIASTTFRCSHFGSYYPKSSRYGWDMMNYCLEQPCLGFAYHPKYPIRISHSGAFSYSATARTSGISHNSTSFVGCDNEKCCACFGPIGGKKNYCAAECTAINGGTVVKNVYTWFWVRSSLPKRPWNKCMEYKVTTPKRKVVWYKLSNGNTVPVMGRCNQNEALLNDGLVVVPNSSAAQKIPPIPGLLEYRKDNKKLYVRSNETWNVIGEENEVLEKAAEQVKPKLNQVKNEANKLNTTKFSQLEKSLTELKSQLASVNKTISDHIGEAERVSGSCASLYKSGVRHGRVYTIDPDGLGSFRVKCDMTTDGGGWTVFQRRQDGSKDFYRGWSDYKAGFGNLNDEFWLGLDYIHRLTKSGQTVLRIDLMDFKNNKAYAKYGTFAVASESEKYKLSIGSFSGNAGDYSLSYHNGMKFTTKDKDNDQWGRNCAVNYKSAWWYNSCHYSNLNGQYLKSGARSTSGITWYYWKNDWRSMKKVEMKTRSSQF